jgi:DNA-binding beta-propeller fold protein YncE
MMAARHNRNFAWIGVVALLAAWIAGCGKNSAVVGVTVSGPTASPVTVLLKGQAQFAATVSGISTTSVFWQICLPAINTTTQPTNCTAPQPPTTGATVPATPLTGYGTITVNGLYTAPPAIPAQDNFVVMASSTARPTSFGISFINLDSGVSVVVNPTTATIGPGETFQFTATVSGLSTNGVNWSVPSPASQFGTISNTGLYQAPPTPPTTAVTITATSTADNSKTGTATVSVGPGGPPVVTNIDPTVAAQGSVQQDIYVNGSNLLTTSVAEISGVPVTTTFISTTLLRATIPAGQLTQAGTFPVTVVTQNGSANTPGPTNFSVFPVRPAVVSSAPDSVTQNGASAAVNLTGGFYVAGVTSTTFQGAGVTPTVANSRQMSIPVPAGPLATPGLYPIVLQNSGIPATQPSKSALNLGVTPLPTSIPTAPTATGIAVGLSPSAVAIDEANGLAVVANSGSGTVSLINMVTHLAVGGPIAVGNNPTGVAVDDLLADSVALVVNSADQTVTAIDLISGNKATLSVRFDTGSNPPLPFSVGVNPVTHRAIVAYQSTNEATVLDVSEAGGVPAIAVVQQVGGFETNFTTGVAPAVAVDPGINWAVITPGGTGSVNLVDLGVHAGTDEPNGRAPQVVGGLSISATLQGVGINSQTHKALLTDPTSGLLYTFSLLDNTEAPVVASGGGAFVQNGFAAAAASPLENVGIAVNILNKSAVVVDLQNAQVLQTVSGIGSNSVLPAVAVDPVTNQAIVVNQQDNAVAIVSLGNTINPLQITESRPVIAFGGPGAANLTITIDGSGFIGGSQVQLDGTAVPVTSVSANGRQIVASVPGAMLAGARRYFVQVNNGGSAISNVAYLTVVQPIAVGRTPVGVAVDTDRDLAVATNSVDGNVSLISLAAPSPESPESLGPVGIVGSPVTVGTMPEGVSVLPREGIAVVANNGSNNATLVDVTGVKIPVTVDLCSGGCTNPTGVAMNQDLGVAVVTNTNSSQNGNPGINGVVAFISSLNAAQPGVTTLTVDQNPVAAAVDPGLNLAAVAAASAQSAVDLLDMSPASFVGRASGGTLQNPSGVVFDPVNQIFVVANSLLNNLVFIDPVTFIQTSSRVGINPTSLDYNFQTSTLVSLSSSTHILAVLDYVCPPNVLLPACAAPQVRAVLGLGGVQNSNFVLGPNAVAVDPKLNLGALVDPDNNRVLLVPLPR